MIINNKGKLFGKSSIIDIIIVLIIIVGVIGAVYKYSKSDTGNPIFTKLDDIQIKFYQAELPDYVAKAVKIGDPARESLQGTSFGTVSDIEVGEAVIWVGAENGQFVRITKEGYASVTITMDVKGQITENGVTIDKANYRIGETITLLAGNAGFYPVYSAGRISDIKIKE